MNRQKGLISICIVLLLSQAAFGSIGFDLGLTPFSDPTGDGGRAGLNFSITTTGYNNRVFVSILTANVYLPAFEESSNDLALDISSALFFSVYNPIYVGARAGFVTVPEGNMLPDPKGYTAIAVRLQNQAEGLQFFMEINLGLGTIYSRLSTGINLSF